MKLFKLGIFGTIKALLTKKGRQNLSIASYYLNLIGDYNKKIKFLVGLITESDELVKIRYKYELTELMDERDEIIDEALDFEVSVFH